MAASSILIDWDTACTMGSTPQELEAYVNIRFALRCASSSEAQRVAAMEELRRMRPWAIAAALPDICAIVRSGTAVAYDTASASILRPIIEQCDPPLATLLGAVWEEFDSGTNSQLLIRLRDASGALVNRRGQDMPDPTHFSLERNQDIALLLAMLEVLAREDSEGSAALLTSDQSTGGARNDLLDLVDRALMMDFGRFVLLSAVDVCLAIKDLRRADVALARLTDAPGREPDVLQRYARLFQLSEVDASAESSARWAAEELATSRHLRKLLGDRFDRASRGDKLEATAFWQDAVLRAALVDSTANAATMIGPLLRPHVVAIPKAVVVNLPGVARKSGPLGWLLKELMREAGETVEQVEFGPEGCSWHFAVAPWFHVDRKRMPHDGAPWLPQQSLFVRMVGWVATVCELMTVSGTANHKDAATRYLGTFILHAYHWLDALTRFGDRPDVRVSQSVVDLARAAKPLVESVAGGRYQDPAPAFFIDLVNDILANGFLLPEAGEAQADEQPRRQDATDRVLDSALMLLQRSIGVTEDVYRVGRWLERENLTLLPDAAIRWFGGRAKPPFRPLYIAKCVKRFLDRRAWSPDDVGETPLRAVEAKGSWSAVGSHRALLLADTRRYAEWSSGESEVVVQKGAAAAALTIALQRVAAAHADSATPKELARAWLGHLHRSLSDAGSLPDYDRFLQFRLIELLEEGVFAQEPHLTALIVRRLIEFGSNHAFKLLGRWLVSGALKSEHDALLRIQFFEALSRYVDALEIARVEGEEPRNPESRARHLARARVLERLIACTLIASEGQERSLNQALVAAARESRVKLCAEQAEDIGTEIPIEVEADGSPLPIVDHPGCDLRTASLVAFDATSAILRRIGPPTNGSAGANLFAGAHAEPRAKRTYVGIVANVTQRSEVKIWLRPGEFVTASHQPLETGEIVSVDHAPSRSGRFEGSAAGMRRLSDRTRGRVTDWDVRSDSWPVPGGTIRLAAGPRRLPWTEQTPNFLALLAPRPDAATSYRIRMSIDRETERASAAVGRFSDFLLDNAGELDSGANVVLCIRSITRDELGELTHLEAETWPLRRYLFDMRCDFDEKARDVLDEALVGIGEERDPAGLLVVAELDIASEGPRLVLATSQGRIAVPWSRESVTAPFDDRNLRWREIFVPSTEEGEEDDDDSALQVFASRLQGDAVRHVADLPPDLQVEGFPKQVALDLGSPQRLPETFPVVIHRRQTSRPHLAQFRAEAIFANELQKMPVADLVGLVDWLLGSNADRLFEIRSCAPGISRAGIIYAFTRENLPIQLIAESVSLLPLEIGSDDMWASATRTAQGRAYFLTTKQPPQFDIGQVPEAAFRSDVAAGVLVSVPAPRRGGSANVELCRVAWRVADGIDEKPLRIDNLQALTPARLKLGSRLSIDRRTGTPVLKLEQPNIMAEALWKRVETVEDEHYVGTTQVAGEGNCDLYETAPGKIYVKRAESASGADHARFVAQHLGTRKLTVLTEKPKKSVHFKRDPSWRLGLAVESDGRDAQVYLCGVSAEEKAPQGAARLTGYELLADDKVVPGWLRIRRRLRIRSEERQAAEIEHRPVRRVETEDQVNARRRERALLLEQWRAAPFVQGSHDAKRNRFMPEGARARRVLPEGVAIEPGGYSHRSPHTPTEAYARLPARIVFRQSNELVGSYLDAPLAGLGDLIGMLGNPPVDTRIPLREIQLSYVGFRHERETTTHLFEWGYGWCIAIEAASLQFKKESIEEGELVLAFGDLITEIMFVADGDELILSIEEVKLSRAHTLYRQAKRHRILHIMHVSCTKDLQVKVDRVEGYSSSHATEIIDEFRVDATLEPATAREVANLIADRSDGTSAPQGLVLYGRLVTQAFESSGGVNLVYGGIRIGTKAGNGFDGLRRGDRIFLRARERLDLRNDIGLRVEPLPALAQELIDPEIYAPARDGTMQSQLLILRRSFSYDEGALDRITADNARELEGRILLARVTNVDGGRINLNHLNGTPPRDPNVLDGLLAQAGGYLFCVFAERRTVKGGKKTSIIEKKTIVIEIRPGALIEIDQADLVLPDDELAHGDILRIERRETDGTSVYACVFAVYSDRRYAQARRPAVALPKNPLSRDLTPPFEPDDLRRATECFSVGDFRQLTATLATEERGRGSSPRAEVLEEFMSRPHPKLAWLYVPRDASERAATPRLLPDGQREILAGRLELIDGGDSHAPEVRAVPLAGANPELAELEVNWRDLTFCDATARDIAARLARGDWGYHDQRTIVWGRGADGTLTVEQPLIARHTVRDGPLFFVRDRSVATLRYKASQIDQYALSLTNLRGELPKAQSSIGLEAFVAGVPTDGGLYIETLPGRVYEVPWALCKLDSLDPIALDRLAWTMFAAGDVVRLKRAGESGDRHGQEGISLSWRHGVRNAIGPIGALLPRSSVDPVQGSAVYGVGRFCVTIPANRPDQLWRWAIVGGDPPFYSAPIRTRGSDEARGPQRGDVVFLTIGSDGKIEAAGFPGWTAVPDRTWLGQSAPSPHDLVFVTGNGRKGFNVRQLGELIGQVGGTFAVTVESVISRQEDASGLIFVSRRVRSTQSAAAGGSSSERKLSRDDVVAVAVDYRNRVEPIDWPDVSVFPDKNWPWDQDPLMSKMVQPEGNGRWRFSATRLKECAEAAGGAFPFTVERVMKRETGEIGPIFVSRRLQHQQSGRNGRGSDPEFGLSAGTTLLMTLGSRGDLAFAGLPGWHGEPASRLATGEEIDWRADSLLRGAVERDGAGQPRADARRIVERIAVLGGALPVTLEQAEFNADGTPGRIYYSRRYQNVRLETEQIAIAKVVGFLPGIELAVLAIGGRYLEMPARRLVEGAPKHLWRDVVDTLARCGTDLWVHRIADGYHVGIPGAAIASGAFRVRSITTVRHGAADGAASGAIDGIVCSACHDHRLYWLPAAETGAARLSAHQATTVFLRNRDAFEVVRMPQVGVSIVQHPRLRAELATLRPGKPTTVRPIGDTATGPDAGLPAFSGFAKGRCHLARSTSTGLLVTLLLDEDKQLDAAAGPIAVQIAWRWFDGSALRLAVVERGNQPIRSDIPDVLLAVPDAPLPPSAPIVFGVGDIINGADSTVGNVQPIEKLAGRARELLVAPVYSMRATLQIMLQLRTAVPPRAQAIDKAVWDLAADIGRRSLRSFHLEPVAFRHARSLRGLTPQYESSDLGKRVEEVLALIGGHAELVTAGEVSEKLESLVLYANLHPQLDDARDFVHALSAALGGRHDLSRLARRSNIVGELAKAMRPFALGRDSFSSSDAAALEANAMQVFADVLQKLAERDFDIPLPKGFSSGSAKPGEC